tara:strand:+ start:3374 stop:3637 length:264 start_codon:yes stop_codon:yes gene_type:complete
MGATSLSKSSESSKWDLRVAATTPLPCSIAERNAGVIMDGSFNLARAASSISSPACALYPSLASLRAALLNLEEPRSLEDAGGIPAI